MLEKIAAVAAADPIMEKLRETIKERFPNYKCNMDHELLQFLDVRDRLTINECEELIMLAHRVVIPKILWVMNLRLRLASIKRQTSVKGKQLLFNEWNQHIRSCKKLLTTREKIALDPRKNLKERVALGVDHREDASLPSKK